MDGAVMTRYVYVNVYETGRDYGGPEEGGWYYDVGTAYRVMPVRRDRADACLPWTAARLGHPVTPCPSSVAHRPRAASARKRTEAQRLVCAWSRLVTGKRREAQRFVRASSR